MGNQKTLIKLIILTPSFLIIMFSCSTKEKHDDIMLQSHLIVKEKNKIDSIINNIPKSNIDEAIFEKYKLQSTKFQNYIDSIKFLLIAFSGGFTNDKNMKSQIHRPHDENSVIQIMIDMDNSTKILNYIKHLSQKIESIKLDHSKEINEFNFLQYLIRENNERLNSSLFNNMSVAQCNLFLSRIQLDERKYIKKVFLTNNGQ